MRVKSIGFLKPIGIAVIGCSSAQSGVGQCVEVTRPLTISADSIGPWPLQEPLARLLEICPSAAADLRVSAEGYGSPALRFDFVGATVRAVQFRDSLDLDMPAALFEIEGDGWLLGGAEADATWDILSAQYPEYSWSADTGTLYIDFDALPNISIHLVGPDGGSLGHVDDPEQIPSDARVARILVTPGGAGPV